MGAEWSQFNSLEYYSDNLISSGLPVYRYRFLGASTRKEVRYVLLSHSFQLCDREDLRHLTSGLKLLL
jgi:hypothetical protein